MSYTIMKQDGRELIHFIQREKWREYFFCKYTFYSLRN